MLRITFLNPPVVGPGFNITFTMTQEGVVDIKIDGQPVETQVTIETTPKKYSDFGVEALKELAEEKHFSVNEVIDTEKYIHGPAEEKKDGHKIYESEDRHDDCGISEPN